MTFTLCLTVYLIVLAIFIWCRGNAADWRRARREGLTLPEYRHLESLGPGCPVVCYRFKCYLAAQRRGLAPIRAD